MKEKKEKEEKKKKENRIERKQDIHLTAKSPAPPKIFEDIRTDPPALAGPIVLFRQSFKTYQEKFWTLIALAFIPFIFNVFSSIVPLPADNPSLHFGLSLLKLALAGFIGIWSGVALYVAIGEKATVIEAYQRSLIKILPYFWVCVLVGLIIFGGLVLFVAPGVIFAIWFYLALFAVVFEKDRGLNALFKSRAYIKGRGLGVLGRVAAFALFYLAVILIASLMILAFGGEVAEWLTLLLFVFAAPLAVIYPFFIYQSLRKIKPEIVGQKISGRSWPWIIIATIGLIGLMAAFFLPLWFGFLNFNPMVF